MSTIQLIFHLVKSQITLIYLRVKKDFKIRQG